MCYTSTQIRLIVADSFCPSCSLDHGSRVMEHSGNRVKLFFCFLTFLFFTLWFKHDRHHTLLLADYGCDEMEGGCDIIRCVIGGYFLDYLNLHPPQNFVMTVQTDVLKIIR